MPRIYVSVNWHQRHVPACATVEQQHQPQLELQGRRSTGSKAGRPPAPTSSLSSAACLCLPTHGSPLAFRFEVTYPLSHFVVHLVHVQRVLHRYRRHGVCSRLRCPGGNGVNPSGNPLLGHCLRRFLSYEVTHTHAHQRVVLAYVTCML